MSARTWLVARRLRDDETHLGEPGEWRMSFDLHTEDEARARTRYFEEALRSRSLAVDLDSLEAELVRAGATS